MSVKHLIKARRPNGGTKRPITDHMQPGESGSHEDADGSPYDSPNLHPSEYIVSVDEQHANDVSEATQELACTVLPKPYAQTDLDNGVSKTDLLDRALGASIGYTDADGLGIVPVHRLIPSVVEDVGAAVRSGWGRSSAARRRDGSRYVAVGANVPRLDYPLDGSAPGLLVEGTRTNHVLWSADPSSWDTAAVTLVSAETSLIDGETAQRVTDIGNSFNTIKADAGTFTSDREAALFIVEQGTAAEAELIIRDATASDSTRRATIDWSAGALKDKIGLDDSYIDIIDPGPSGAKAARVRLYYSGQTQGNLRQLWVAPAPLQTGTDTIVHYGHVEEHPEVSAMPIVTGSSASARQGDSYAIPASDLPLDAAWTWYFEFVPEVHLLDRFPKLIKATDQGDRIFLGGGADPQSSPFSASFHDDSGVLIDHDTVLPEFQVSKIALSVTPSTARLSVNGTTKEASYDGAMLDESTSFKLGAGGDLIGRYQALLGGPTFPSTSDLNALTS